MIESGEGVDWATAEALAFATLLVEGTSLQFSGVWPALSVKVCLL